MATRPSQRMHHVPSVIEANLTPMMNLMVVLIPLLLTSAEFVHLGVIELNLPPSAGGPGAQKVAQMPQEFTRKLDLAVTITDRGFFISSSLAVLSGTNPGEPTIPKRNGEYDFQALSQQLYEIKKKAQGRFDDIDRIILIAEDDIEYQTVVSTMDAARAITINGKTELLFPDVLLSAGIM